MQGQIAPVSNAAWLVVNTRRGNVAHSFELTWISALVEASKVTPLRAFLL